MRVKGKGSIKDIIKVLCFSILEDGVDIGKMEIIEEKSSWK